VVKTRNCHQIGKTIHDAGFHDQVCGRATHRGLEQIVRYPGTCGLHERDGVSSDKSDFMPPFHEGSANSHCIAHHFSGCAMIATYYHSHVLPDLLAASAPSSGPQFIEWAAVEINMNYTKINS